MNMVERSDLAASTESFNKNQGVGMKRVIFAGSFVLLLSIFSLAQEPGSSSAGSNGRIQLDPGSSIQAELQDDVDVKRSRVGDQVVLKTTKAIKRGRDTVIPKGTNLIGRITEVQQRTKDNTSSRIGMVFDRIEGKNLSAPISASIVSITNAQASTSLGDRADTGLSGGTSTSSPVSGEGSGTRGGLLGGVTNTAGSVAGTATQTVGGVTNTAAQTVGSVTNTAGQTVGSTAGTLGRTLSGIQISRSASGSAQSSTTLSSPNRNIKLEKGVMFQLQFSN
jgi:hypothetical protein